MVSLGSIETIFLMGVLVFGFGRALELGLLFPSRKAVEVEDQLDDQKGIVNMGTTTR